MSAHSTQILPWHVSWCIFPRNKFCFFKGGNKTFIKVSAKEKVSWDQKVNGFIGFTCNLLKAAFSYLIKNCFVDVGNIMLKQHIGI